MFKNFSPQGALKNFSAKSSFEEFQSFGDLTGSGFFNNSNNNQSNFFQQGPSFGEDMGNFFGSSNLFGSFVQNGNNQSSIFDINSQFSKNYNSGDLFGQFQSLNLNCTQFDSSIFDKNSVRHF